MESKHIFECEFCDYKNEVTIEGPATYEDACELCGKTSKGGHTHRTCTQRYLGALADLNALMPRPGGWSGF